jgi:hypothetical protein
LGADKICAVGSATRIFSGGAEPGKLRPILRKYVKLPETLHRATMMRGLMQPRTVFAEE